MKLKRNIKKRHLLPVLKRVVGSGSEAVSGSQKKILKSAGHISQAVMDYYQQLLKEYNQMGDRNSGVVYRII